MNSDELGAKGESRFRELCADAQLICNPSERDRAGWDFIVEFPFEPTAESNLTLDKRGPPISCHVQVKTIWATDRCSFSMRLSSAERLAKELKPALVYVLRVGKDLEIVDAYLVHILDENLATILKRLRREEVKGTLAINHQKITLDAKKCGQRLTPSGGVLREVLSKLCGTDLHAYVGRKKKQLEELGYGPGRHTMNVSIRLRKEDIADVFLGRKKAELTRLQDLDTRFGITLRKDIEEKHLSEGFQIKPHPCDTCTVTFRGGEISPPAVFRCEMFVPVLPGLSFNEVKFIISNPLFELEIQPPTMKLSQAIDLEILRLRVSEWVHLFRMRRILSEGKGTFDIKSNKGLQLTFPVPPPEQGGPQDDASELDAFEAAEYVLKVTGEPDLEASYDEIANSTGGVRIARQFLADPQGLPPFSFEVDAKPDDEGNTEAEVLYASTCAIAALKFAYCGVIIFRSEVISRKVIWRAEKARPLRVERISGPDSYRSFVDNAANDTGLQHRYVVPIRE
jgi:hypothetical protein